MMASEFLSVNKIIIVFHSISCSMNLSSIAAADFFLNFQALPRCSSVLLFNIIQYRSINHVLYSNREEAYFDCRVPPGSARTLSSHVIAFSLSCLLACSLIRGDAKLTRNSIRGVLLPRIELIFVSHSGSCIKLQSVHKEEHGQKGGRTREKKNCRVTTRAISSSWNK